MKYLILLVSILLCFSLMLSGCDVNPITDPEATGPEATGIVTNESAFEELEIGSTFLYHDPYSTGSLQCTVTDAWLVTNQSECPPSDWFFSPLATIEDGKAAICNYEDWFTPGGAFEQGCRIVVVDVTIKNVDAQSSLYEDPTIFSMTDVLKLIDMNLPISTNDKASTYQGYLEIGFSLLNQFVPEEEIVSLDPYVHSDSCYVQLPPGESVSFNLCFPVFQNDDGSVKDFSQLALQSNFGYREVPALFKLDLEEPI